VLQPAGRNGGCIVVDMPKRKSAQARRQRICLVVIRYAQRPLELDVQLGLGMNLRERKHEPIFSQFNHDTLRYYQLPSRTSRTKRRTACSGRFLRSRMSWANSLGRLRMICCKSAETLPARAKSTSGSSSSSRARATMVFSDGGGCSPRSTLLRYEGSTPIL